MCGENLDKATYKYPQLGSPPHVRGKHSYYYAIAGSAGITPACAGKTCFERTYLCYPRDHPRMCGENTKKSLSHQRLPIVKIPFFMSLSASAIVAVASDNA